MKIKTIIATLIIGFIFLSVNAGAQVAIKVKPTPPAKKVVKKVKSKPGKIWVKGHWKFHKHKKKDLTGRYVRQRKLKEHYLRKELCINYYI